MAHEELVELTAEQKERLSHERYVAELIKIREAKSEPPAESKSRLQKFFETSAGTALITVVLGGLMGSVVSAVFQMYSKQREMQLIAYQQRLDKRQETIKATFDLIGACFAPADTLVRFRTEFGNDPTDKKGEELKTWDKKWTEIRDKFEEAQRKWSSEEKKSALSLSYYFNDSKQVKAAWKDVNRSLTEYFAYVADNCRDASPEICQNADKGNNFKQKRSNLDMEIEYLGCTIEEASKDAEIKQTICQKSAQASAETPAQPATQTQ